jgi:hypothetical protein
MRTNFLLGLLFNREDGDEISPKFSSIFHVIHSIISHEIEFFPQQFPEFELYSNYKIMPTVILSG